MIIVKACHGLGNQLFQYAAGRNLAIQNNTELFIFYINHIYPSPRKYLLHNFQTIGTFIQNEELLDLINKIPVKIIEENNIRESTGLFPAEHLKTLHENIILDGYWHSEKYFRDIASTISNDFSLVDNTSVIHHPLYQSVCAKNSVAVHIRRGDYVTNPKIREFHGECRPAYYSTGLNYIARRQENIHIFVFSDDIVWAQNNFQVPYPVTFVTPTTDDTCFIDLLLMSACKHFVIANSTFSWWAAWLAKNPEKIVICPKQWLKNINQPYTTPDKWVSIDNYPDMHSISNANPFY